MSSTAESPGLGSAGLRFGIGVVLIICGYLALLLIPLVTRSDLSMGLKTGLSGFLALMPVITKIAAIAVMGKPGFNLLKQHVFKFLGRFRPADQVSRQRYRTGLVLFILALVFDSLLPYAPGYLVDWQANEIFWSLVGDAVLIVSLFVLGGEFWSKLAALFDYSARVVAPDREIR